ncbi:hypothetical protein GOP47_0028374 [Adiantum capillus-veneris]|nr:hypothetical protein GOP47_0028374 [Adiantum capillus-veneris]
MLFGCFGREMYKVRSKSPKTSFLVSEERMCSLQLVRLGSNTVSESTVSVHKVQCSRLQSCTISSGEHCGFLRRDSLLQSDWSIDLWKQLHGGAYANAHSPSLRFKVVKVLTQSQLFLRCTPPVGLIIFGLWGLLPSARFICRHLFQTWQRDDRQWLESQARNILTSYLRPLLLWSGVILVCRALDPLVLATEASQAIKQRILNFVRSLSTVLAFAYCASSLSQQLQKVMQDKQGAQDTRSVGAEFVGNTVYTAVWIAALCLFMELLGFSTQKWLTAGGLGTVLLTLAGREIFTNFLSSIMIHATRPFIVNEWIQTKIEGYEVSGTVEHVGWWSPTIVRGDDREAVHIPNHKFTVSVVRNLSQKSHWRIKTYLGISHLDSSKITSIVADMRKVISKHPQVEQRRLHRRVFLESIDPENQFLMVLISCFVKTSHFEEYLRVKETILLDLLKVISHHHARLATPIRTMQRLSDDSESRSSPFRDISRSSESYKRPYLLIEATAVAAGHDADQSPSTTTQAKADSPLIDSSLTGSENVARASKAEKPKDGSLAFEKPPANIRYSGPLHDVSDAEKPEETGKKSKVEDASAKVIDATGGTANLVEDEKTGVEHRAGESATLLKKGERGATERQTSQAQAKIEMELPTDIKQAFSSSNATQAACLPSCKQQGDQTSSPTGKHQLKENLVLGVALDGPKRTLALENEVLFANDKNEQKELVASRNSNPGNAGKERKEGREGSQSASPERGYWIVRVNEHSQVTITCTCLHTRMPQVLVHQELINCLLLGMLWYAMDES